MTNSESYMNGPSADPNGGANFKHLMNNDDNLIEHLNHVLVNQNSFRERPIVVAEMRPHFDHHLNHMLVPVREPIALIGEHQSLPGIYKVLQKCGVKLCRLIKDINQNNFYPVHFTCFAHIKKLRKIANFYICEKNIVVFCCTTKEVFKT